MLDLATVSDRTILRLSSWVPSHNFSGPVVWEGRPLPLQVGQVLDGEPRALCTSPQEWLLVLSRTDVTRLRGAVASELSRQGLALVDLTPGLRILELRGPATREILSKSCGLDLHPQIFGVGQCARTRFANIPVVIDSTQATDAFDLYVAHSYLAYLRSWLEDAALGSDR
jgi:sarcosine oxidase, subunit gamma